MINVLVIKKDGQENYELNKELPKWQSTLENKLNIKVTIKVMDDIDNLHLAIERGHLKDYLIIFTPYIEGDEIFDYMERFLKHTIIFRINDDKVVLPYTPKNENTRNKNVYPQFSIKTLNISANTLVPIIRAKLNERKQDMSPPEPPISFQQQQEDLPSQDLIEKLKGGVFFVEDEEKEEDTIADESFDNDIESTEDVEFDAEIEDEIESEVEVSEDYEPQPPIEPELHSEEMHEPLLNDGPMDEVIEDEKINEEINNDDLVHFEPQSDFIHQSQSNAEQSRNQNSNTKVVEEEKATQTDQSQFDDDSFNYERTRTIQKQLFAKRSWSNHKTIGIWSPLHKKGVTTFTINYALFLAENRIFTVVLEGLSKDAVLKHWLKRYTPIPKKWSSYAKTIHSDVDPSKANWSYRNILFLPLDDDDCTLEWNSEKLELYMCMPNLMDVTLVDMPTGEMAPYTLDSLIYLDELWVLVDDTYQEYLAWKEYIHLLQKKFKIDVKLVFNQKYDFSQTKLLANEMDLDLIGTLPAMHEEVMKSYYSTEPLYAVPSVREKVYEDFCKLTHHLLGEEVEITATQELSNNSLQDESLWKKVKRWLKG